MGLFKNIVLAVATATLALSGVDAEVQEIKSQVDLMKVIAAPANIGKPIVADVWASWCGPCMNFAPIFKKMSEEPAFKNSVVFVKINFDDNEWLGAAPYNVSSLPTFFGLNGIHHIKSAKKVEGSNEKAVREMIKNVMLDKGDVAKQAANLVGAHLRGAQVPVKLHAH